MTVERLKRGIVFRTLIMVRFLSGQQKSIDVCLRTMRTHVQITHTLELFISYSAAIARLVNGVSRRSAIIDAFSCVIVLTYL